jgi:hypothetical protein
MGDEFALNIIILVRTESLLTRLYPNKIYFMAEVGVLIYFSLICEIYGTQISCTLSVYVGTFSRKRYVNLRSVKTS